ncbi:MAG: hypothetical protein JST77_00355 [Acidobacteria bacterium]|nr:hypothetical protein [Acidobacteriota bacterium]
MQADNWALIKKDAIHLIFLTGMFFFAVVGAFIYFSITNKLRSARESAPEFFQRKEIFETFSKYHRLADQHSWPSWLPAAFWIALLLAGAFGALLVYWP